jgi:hypothetical protein
MKKTCTIILLLVGISWSTFAQSSGNNSSGTEKTNQAGLFNEIYAGYGAGSIFYFTGRMKHTGDYPTEMTSYNGSYLGQKTFTTPSSPGTFFIGYGRTLNRVVSMGILFGFQRFTYTGTTHYTSYYEGSYSDSSKVKLSSDDILLTGIARLLFSYVNKPSVRVYSGIGIGFTVNFGTGKISDYEYSERRIWPGGQLTLMGVRFGRAFGGFFEFGFGSFGIINAGISYKFKD